MVDITEFLAKAWGWLEDEALIFLLGQMKGLLENFLGITNVITMGLAGVAFLLTIFALAQRWLTTRTERKIYLLRPVWMEMICRYLVGDAVVLKEILEVTKGNRQPFLHLLQQYLMDMEGSDRQVLVELVIELGYIEDLHGLVNHRREEQRAIAVSLLGLIGDQGVIPKLREKFGDKSELVRRNAATALMRLKDADSIGTIFDKFGEDPKLRGRIRYLLMDFGPEICPRLEEILFEPDFDLPTWWQVVILQVLGHFVQSEKSSEILYLATSTDDREVKLAGIKALAGFDDPTLLPYLESVVEEAADPVATAFAVPALGRIGNEASAYLLAAQLANTDFWVVKGAAEALVALGEVAQEALALVEQEGLTPMAEKLMVEARAA